MALGEAIAKAIEEIEELKNKIRKYRDKYSSNETLVRYSLIDPVLRMVGWDTSDPAQVIPEYSNPVGRADYALLSRDGKVKALVGAKKLGTNENLSQHLAYCISVPSQYFIATDGNNWELYDAFKQVTIEEKLIEKWNILNDPPGEIIRKILTISNFSEFGKETKNYLGDDEYSKETTPETDFPKYAIFEADHMKRSPPSRPKRLLILGQEVRVSTVKEVLIAVAEWLIQHGKLKANDVPIESGPSRYIVNREPIHKSGKKFFDDYTLSNGLHLEVHGSHQAVESNAKFLMEKFGYGKNSITIEWNESRTYGQ
ncbi:hypothetical protein ApAK_03180 [Thermoplasmatales archaeon AK]|nr:hypothetical protein [Thermoplasmatales archaeon AK]